MQYLTQSRYSSLSVSLLLLVLLLGTLLLTDMSSLGELWQHIAYTFEKGIDGWVYQPHRQH